MANYIIKNWENFQHYKDRTPPWIKLHYEILTSKDWVKFDDASKLLAVVCMMLASRNDGVIEDDLDYIQQVAHLCKKPDLKPLIDSGFLIHASGMIADASTLQADAIIEKRREEKKREDKYPEWLDLNLWNDFIQHRKDLKSKMNLKAEKLNITLLEKIIAKGYTQEQIINRAIANGWKSFYEPNDSNGKPNQPKLIETEAQRRARLSC